jgi:hypothetical protein
MDIGSEPFSTIRDRKAIAVGSAIREISRSRSAFSDGRWLKVKGFARVYLEDGRLGGFTGTKPTGSANET